MKALFYKGKFRLTSSRSVKWYPIYSRGAGYPDLQAEKVHKAAAEGERRTKH